MQKKPTKVAFELRDVGGGNDEAAGEGDVVVERRERKSTVQRELEKKARKTVLSLMTPPPPDALLTIDRLAELVNNRTENGVTNGALIPVITDLSAPSPPVFAHIHFVSVH